MLPPLIYNVTTLLLVAMISLSLPPNGSIHITQHVETMVVCARKYKMTSLEVRACQKQRLSA